MQICGLEATVQIQEAPFGATIDLGTVQFLPRYEELAIETLGNENYTMGIFPQELEELMLLHRLLHFPGVVLPADVGGLSAPYFSLPPHQDFSIEHLRRAFHFSSSTSEERDAITGWLLPEVAYKYNPLVIDMCKNGFPGVKFRQPTSEGLFTAQSLADFMANGPSDRLIGLVRDHDPIAFPELWRLFEFGCLYHPNADSLVGEVVSSIKNDGHYTRETHWQKPETFIFDDRSLFHYRLGGGGIPIRRYWAALRSTIGRMRYQ